MLGKTGAETGFTVALRRGAFPPGDIADAPMPAGNQELGKRLATGKIIGCDGGEPVFLLCTVEQHHRDAGSIAPFGQH